MELLAVVLMIAGGGVVAAVVIIAVAISRGEKRNAIRRSAAPDRDGIAASLLFHVLRATGDPPEDVLRDIRNGGGLRSTVTSSIDIRTWGERYAQISSPSQRRDLLETAVRLAVAHRKLIPLLQYVALLDLAFSLGFQTSELANLRAQYGFDYVDHAKDGRPRDADRASGRTTFFARGEPDRAALLRVLELEGRPTRQEIISAYRRLAAQHHPDRFHAGSPEAQSAAAGRFIEITRAYEALITADGD